ncbi:hypothetical protein MKX03_008443 [Papaver bracteatum]|nr:hypothetical protein MKX03_008443 [Papaver bracteatum]
MGVVSGIAVIIHLLGVKCADQYLGSTSAIAIIVTCLPFLYGFLQSLLKGYWEGDTHQYLNACKHLLTVAMTIISAMKYILKDETSWYRYFSGAWFPLVVLNTLACFAWDISKDWNLRISQFIVEKKLVRPSVTSKFVSDSKWLYVIVVLDFLARASWGFRLSRYSFTNRWVLLAMSIIELLRRGIWIILRIEAEFFVLAANLGTPPPSHSL